MKTWVLPECCAVVRRRELDTHSTNKPPKGVALTLVVPANAGTHTPRRCGVARWLSRDFFLITSDGGYGSRRSPGRHFIFVPVRLLHAQRDEPQFAIRVRHQKQDGFL